MVVFLDLAPSGGFPELQPPVTSCILTYPAEAEVHAYILEKAIRIKLLVTLHKC